MGYKKQATFTPPDLSSARTVEDLRIIMERWAQDLCAKLNSELRNVERTTQ